MGRGGREGGVGGRVYDGLLLLLQRRMPQVESQVRAALSVPCSAGKTRL
jgi:hypothetical protein